MLSQPIILKTPEKANVENWMYHLQGRAVGEIQLISSWSHSLQHLKGSHILVLELPWKLQPKVLGAQKNLVAHGILHIQRHSQPEDSLIQVDTWTTFVHRQHIHVEPKAS